MRESERERVRIQNKYNIYANVVELLLLLVQLNNKLRTAKLSTRIGSSSKSRSLLLAIPREIRTLLDTTDNIRRHTYINYWYYFEIWDTWCMMRCTALIIINSRSTFFDRGMCSNEIKCLLRAVYYRRYKVIRTSRLNVDRWSY